MHLPYPRAAAKPGFDQRFDMRSFGEPVARLRSIPTVDNGEPLVSLAELCPKLALLPGCLPYLRETVARMACAAQSNLPDGLTLTIGTALRTIEMQTDLRGRIEAEQAAAHPEWSRATLMRMINRLVAPIDPRAPAPHLTGGALDVGVLGPDGQRLDFSSPCEGWSAAPTYCGKLSPAARANREMLIESMEQTGLTNYAGEWWHWSYGDQGWALRVGAPRALYGEIKLPNAESLRIPKEEESAGPA